MATRRKTTTTQSASKSTTAKPRPGKSTSIPMGALEEWTNMFVQDVNRFELAELDWPRGIKTLSNIELDAHLTRVTSDSLSLGTITKIFSDLKTYSAKARDVFAELKDFIAKFKDLDKKIFEIVKKLQNADKDDPDAETLILTYLLKGECKDRLGTAIKRPEGEFQKEYFNIGLDLGKILLQRSLDKKYGLLWLADPNENLDEPKKAHKFWETNVTKLSDPLIGSGVSAGLSIIPSLQDDAKKAASMVIGVSSSKTVEALVAKAIDKSPQKWIDYMKAVEEKG